MKRVIFFTLLFFTCSFGFAQNDMKLGSDSTKENNNFIPKPARESDNTAVNGYKIQNDTSAKPVLKRIESYNITTNEEKIQCNKSITEESKLLRVDIKLSEESEKTYIIQDSTSVKK